MIRPFVSSLQNSCINIWHLCFACQVIYIWFLCRLIFLHSCDHVVVQTLGWCLKFILTNARTVRKKKPRTWYWKINLTVLKALAVWKQPDSHRCVNSFGDFFLIWFCNKVTSFGMFTPFFCNSMAAFRSFFCQNLFLMAPSGNKVVFA